MGSTPIRSIMVVVYHVCGASKLSRYIRAGVIKPPVRAWTTIIEAERFSKQTGRPIILRLKFPADAKVLEGHRGMARYIEQPYPVGDMFGSKIWEASGQWLFQEWAIWVSARYVGAHYSV